MLMEAKSRHIICFLYMVLVQLIIFASYSNIIYSPPIFDDYHSFIYQTKIFTGIASLKNIIGLSDTIFGWSRWIPMLTFALDYDLGGGNIAFFHITNIIIHCLVTVSVMYLIYQLLMVVRYTKEGAGIDPLWLSVWISAIWALNPIHTSAVTYIVQRMASIQALFYILSVALYIRGRFIHTSTGRLNRAIPLYFLSLIMTIFSFFSKQNSATLPLTLFFSELWFFQSNLLQLLWNRLKESNWLIRSIAVFILIVAVGSVVYVFNTTILPGYETRRFTLWERLMTESRIVVWYASLLLWPAPSRLSLEHDIVISVSPWSPLTTSFSIISIGCAIWVIVRYRRRYPLVTYAGLWFFTTLLIESTVVPLELIFEHRLYLPSVGFFIIVVMAVNLGSRGISLALSRCNVRDLHVIMWCSFAMFTSLLAMATFARNETWRDTVTMARDSALKAPENPRAHVNLAVSLCRAGKYDEAIKEAEVALQLGKKYYEQYSVAANVIVSAFLEQGKTSEAVHYGESIFDKRPDRVDIGAMPPFCSNMADAYLALGQFKSAYSWTLKGFNYALSLGSSNNIDLLVGTQAKILSAVDGKGIDLDGDGEPDPGKMKVYAWMGKKFLTIGNLAEARNLASLALLEDPEDRDAKTVLGIAATQEKQNQLQGNNWDFSRKYLTFPISEFKVCMYVAHLCCKEELPAMLRRFGERSVDLALKLDSHAPDAHLLKGWYYYERGQFEKAVEQAKQSVDLDPGYARAWLGLGFFLTRVHEDGAAVAAFQKTLELYPGYPKRATIQNIVTSLQQDAKSS